MNINELIALWNEWSEKDDFSCVVLEDGRKYVWSFGVMFSRKTCNVRIGDWEKDNVKREFLYGRVRFESEALEKRRIAAINVAKQAA